MSESAPDESNAKCCGTCGCRSAAAVTARIDNITARLIQDHTFLRSLVAAHGSPLNIVIPDTVVRNQEAFRSILREFHLQGEVLFTTKPNKSSAILQCLSRKDSAVDVSSLGALLQAIRCGISSSRIQCSGPKSQDYLHNALSHRAIISIDSLDELHQLEAMLHSDTNISAPRILLRICGFQSQRLKFSPSDAPFGIRVPSVPTALETVKRLGSRVKFEGIHFHLLSGEKEEKLIAFENALEAIISANAMGLRPRAINIGGGFKIRYAADQGEWQRFQSYHRASVLGKVEPVTWDGSGLGLRAEGGRIKGMPAFADHYPGESGTDGLKSFLNLKSPLFDGCSVADLMRDMMLELRVEPGRALLDCAGFTLTDIAAVKESAAGAPLIMLNMNHTNLLSREQKLLTQPIFIPSEERPTSTTSFFLFGNLCIASDLIQYQKVYPGFIPKQGDLLLFANTAAYLMDFGESEILHQSLAKKMAVFLREDQVLSYQDSTIDESVVSTLMEAL